MAAGTRRMVFEVAIDDSKTGQALQRMDKNVGNTAKSFGKAGKAIKVAMAGVATGAVVGFANDTIQSFSNLSESINAVNVQFGSGAQSILDFGETAAEGVGMANSEFNQMAVVTGATLSSFIKDEQAAADETIRLTQRAADMASVFNTDVGEAMTALQSAIRGEMEPIRRFGVSLDDTTIRSRAVAMGLASTTAEVTIQQKQMAALELIYEQTNKTAGDFANTSDSIANRQRILAARFEDAKAAIGEALVPAMEELLPLLEGAIPIVVKLANGIDDLATLLGGTVSRKIDYAARSIKEMNDLIDRGATEAEAWTQVMGGRFTPTAEDVAGMLDAVAEAARIEAREMRLSAKDGIEAGTVMRDTAVGAGELSDSMGDLAAETDEARKAQIELADEQRKAFDPAFKLRDATDKFTAALSEVRTMQREGKTDTRDYKDAVLDLYDAYGDLNYAQSVFDMSEVEGGLMALGTELGIAEGDVQSLIAWLEQLDNTNANPTISVGGQYDPGDLPPPPPGSGPIFLESGGMVPGPVGAPVPAVVHGGEMVLNPAQQRALFSGGGRTDTINVYAGTIVTENQLEDVMLRVLAKNRRRNGLN